MTTPAIDNPTPPRWLHWWAVLTLCTALPLVLLGAEVTTKQVGMVDQVGFRAPWHLLSVQFRDGGLGYVIEHSHRLAGFVVGSCCIVLAVGLGLGARGWQRWLGLAALTAVSAQGVLGIFRVNLDRWLGPWLALIHGCFAQLVLAVLVSVAVLTSPAWRRGGPAAGTRTGPRRATLVLTVALYLQIVFGAAVRHWKDRKSVV